MRYISNNSTEGSKGVDIYGSYNQILNNTIRYSGPEDLNTNNETGEGIWLESSSHHNLIQGNDIDFCGHSDINVIGYSNILKQNTLRGQWGRAVGLRNINSPSGRNVFEDNIIWDVCKLDFGVVGMDALQMDPGCENSIIRRNRIYHVNGNGIQIYSGNGYYTRHNRIYNNTFYDLGRSHLYHGYALYAWEDDGGSLSNNVFKNNIANTALYGNVTYGGNANAGGWVYANNHWDSNGDPKFVDVGTHDFRLQSNSSCIDTGAWLTTITSASGSGTSFAVADAKYFCDGWGITTGDVIQVQGRTATSTITNIDYGTNTITVGTSLTWTNNDGVFLVYYGSAPDIGAFESSVVNPVVVSISASPTSGQAPLTVNFSGGASGGTSPYTYSWNFGDGQSSTQQNPSHTYLAAGNYVATLGVTDSKGATASKTVTITVSVATVLLSASATGSPLSGQAPLAVDFMGSATGGTAPYTYSWSFGDGQSSSEQNPSHIYSSQGIYSVVLTIIDSMLASKTATVPISVSSQIEPLTVSISASPISGSVPLTVSFSGSASGGSSPYSYKWDFGDGQTLTTSNPSYTYSKEGNYTATLTVTDSQNATDKKSVEIIVSTVHTQPSFSCTPDLLIFGGTTSGHKTRDQYFRIITNGNGSLTWNIQENADWLVCSPASGKDNGKVAISVNPLGLPAGTYSAVISINSPEASPSSRTITVALKINDQDGFPVGYLDTPEQGTTVLGNISISGWALDDVEVAKVEIKRDPVPAEGPGSVRSDGLVYIGDAFFIEGARPDVEKRFPDMPLNSRAGWGYMMLTYGLPNRGNGTFTIYAVAIDSAGHQTTLGRKTIIADNANNQNPFGTIDQPGPGETASGTSYYNFGWALTPLPKTIPKDGSTICVWIDGVKLGHPVYNQYRRDIADAYTEYNNSQGAVGYYLVDTTKYENGIHTIGWTVADDQGREDGIGSRYFSIDNFEAENMLQDNFLPMLIDSSRPTENLKIGIREIKKGFSLQAVSERKRDVAGVREIVIEELEPMKIVLNSDGIQGLIYRGWEGDADKQRNLPIGSTLDNKEGVFSWIPTPGFIGTYSLNFVAENGSDRSDPVQIKVTVVPKR
jgi:PKD repeat protein